MFVGYSVENFEEKNNVMIALCCPYIKYDFFFNGILLDI